MCRRTALLRLLQKLYSMENLRCICYDGLGLTFSFRMLGTKTAETWQKIDLARVWVESNTNLWTRTYSVGYKYLNALTGGAPFSIITVTISRYYGWIFWLHENTHTHAYRQNTHWETLHLWAKSSPLPQQREVWFYDVIVCILYIFLVYHKTLWLS